MADDATTPPAKPTARKPATRKPAAKPNGAAKPRAASSKSAAAKSAGARSTAAKPKATPAKRTTATKATPAKRTTAAKPAASTAGKPAARKPAATSTRASAKSWRQDPLGSAVTRTRDLMSRGIVVSRDRIQEAMDDAVERGRIVRRDADELTERIVSSGRKQTQDLLSDLEQLLGRGREQVETAATSARTQATRRGEGVLREVDKARRRAGIGSFPILGYDDLTADQIVKRLGDLTAADLRKVRDYETRHGNRKSVLDTVERKLGV
jgi:hypothetical protein